MNRKTCYCINPSCKCVYGCGCTLADKSVGKCMCCVMEETNHKIDKLRRKKTTISVSGGNCECDLGDRKFYDIIVKSDRTYYSVRYGCLVTFSSDDSEIKCEFDEYIKVSQNNNYDKIESLTYDTSIPIEEEPKNEDGIYYLLFVDRKTLKYGLYYSESITNQTI